MRWGCPFVKVVNGRPQFEYYFVDGRRLGRDSLVLIAAGRSYEDIDGSQKIVPSRLTPESCPFLTVRGGMPLCTLDASYGRWKRLFDVKLSVRKLEYSLLNRNDYTYGLDVPMEPAFKNLVGDFHVVLPDCKRGIRFEELAPLVPKVYYAPQVEVYNFTFGTYYGDPDASRKHRVLYVSCLLYTSPSPRD